MMALRDCFVERQWVAKACATDAWYLTLDLCVPHRRLNPSMDISILMPYCSYFLDYPARYERLSSLNPGRKRALSARLLCHPVDFGVL